MAATFDPTLSQKRDHVRLHLGDTDVANALLQDETIDGKLSEFGYVEALAQLAESLIAQYGQYPSEQSISGGTTNVWADRVKAWKLIVDNARSGKIARPGQSAATRTKNKIGQITAGTEAVNKFV